MKTALGLVLLASAANASTYTVSAEREASKPPSDDRWASRVPRCSDKALAETSARYLYGGSTHDMLAWPVAQVKFDDRGMTLVLWANGPSRRFQITRVVDERRGFIDFDDASFYFALDPIDAHAKSATFTFGLVLHDAHGTPICGTRFVGRAQRAS